MTVYRKAVLVGLDRKLIGETIPVLLNLKKLHNVLEKGIN
jgi:hypothetical protein